MAGSVDWIFFRAWAMLWVIQFFGGVPLDDRDFDECGSSNATAPWDDRLAFDDEAVARVAATGLATLGGDRLTNRTFYY